MSWRSWVLHWHHLRRQSIGAENNGGRWGVQRACLLIACDSVEGRTGEADYDACSSGKRGRTRGIDVDKCHFLWVLAHKCILKDRPLATLDWSLTRECWHDHDSGELTRWGCACVLTACVCWWWWCVHGRAGRREQTYFFKKIVFFFFGEKRW